MCDPQTRREFAKTMMFRVGILQPTVRVNPDMNITAHRLILWIRPQCRASLAGLDT